MATENGVSMTAPPEGDRYVRLIINGQVVWQPSPTPKVKKVDEAETVSPPGSGSKTPLFDASANAPPGRGTKCIVCGKIACIQHQAFNQENIVKTQVKTAKREAMMGAAHL